MQNNILSVLLVALALFAAACTPSTAGSSTATNDEPAAVATAESATEVPTEVVAEEAPTAADAAEATAPAAEEAATAPTEAAVAEPAAATMTKLNLNTVTGDELLATIPDFGNRMVREFQEYRPYISIQQFRREIGKYVDEAQVSFYEDYVYVPVNVNDSDADTLMQIPGVDAATADAIIAARPFDSTDAFLQSLADFAPNADPTIAQAYLEME
ncbi:MAG: helix-hairpin-helix domain-containing protein [Caldilineaceae bacterium]